VRNQFETRSQTQSPFLLAAILLPVVGGSLVAQANKAYVVLQRGDVKAVIVNNEAVDNHVLPGHRAGYSGVASLTHRQRGENLFVPLYAGLNFEHIHDGTVQPREVLFEPRNAPMEIKQVGTYAAELHQPPTPHWQLESWLRYELLEDGALELTLECIPRARTFKNDTIGLFFASYIHQPESLDIHFRGRPADHETATIQWVRGVTPAHGVLATHLALDDRRVFPHDAKFPMTLVFNRSHHRYAEPWYYGVSHGMAFAQIFRPCDQVRLSQSPSGGGFGNPAWDFQWFIPNCKVGRRYRFAMRALYTPFKSQDQLVETVAPHRAAMSAGAQMAVPKIAGPYVHVYQPAGDVFSGPDAANLKAGQHYEEWVPNDHCFVKDGDGRWHAFGITHPRTDFDHVHAGETLSFHAVAPPGRLKDVLRAGSWQDQPKILPPAERPGEIEANHAPYIVKKDGLYHMIYGPTPLRYAVSNDLYEWTPKGPLANAPAGRDPSVIFWDGAHHILVCGQHEVLMARSEDLVTCTGTRRILKMKDGVDAESPSIVRHNDTFYLFVCGWNGRWDRKDLSGAYQHVTYVYQSDDPYSFDSESEVTRLDAHAPEVFQDEEGHWYISSAQWPQRGVSIAPLVWAEDPPTTLSEAVTWLEGEAQRIIRASKRTMADGTAAFPPQVGLGYEAFWLRDYEYTLEGSIASYSDKELTDACRLFVRKLRADGAGTDCVKFDGTAIYRPGFGSLGTHPVADGSQFTVSVAWHTYSRTQDSELLAEIIEPLVKTMHAVPRHPDTGLVHIVPGEPQDRCPYGFTDTIGKQGDVLFCSLLYVQACRQLGDLLDALDRDEEARRWRETGRRITRSIDAIFWDPNVGLFRAATVQCREHDIWGSAFAVYLGVASDKQAQAIATYFQQHYGDIVQAGQIRHLPGGVHWEKARCAPDTYQNGAYWATPTGWFVYTLDLVDPALADQTVIDMVRHFQVHGACEWIFGDRRQLPHYLASAALPLAGIRAMLDRRDRQP